MAPGILQSTWHFSTGISIPIPSTVQIALSSILHCYLAFVSSISNVRRPTTPGRGGLGRPSGSAALSRGAGGSQGGAARGERPLEPRRGWRCPGCVPTSGPVVGLRCPRWPRGSTWRCPRCRHLGHRTPPRGAPPRAWETTPELGAEDLCCEFVRIVESI